MAAERLALVIDDEVPIRLLCRINLEAEGWQVEEASNGLDGLERARSLKPDVVLLDVMMPGLDGWGVAEALLTDESSPPIVFLTARAELRDREQGLEWGLDYITKPFNPLELSSRLERLLDEHSRGDLATRRERLRQLDELRGRVESEA